MSADARECVTEEIISKIGEMLPLEIARSRLVRVKKHDVRFLSRNFVIQGQYELLHGIELVAKYFLITTQAKRNLSSRSGIGGVLSAT